MTDVSFRISGGIIEEPTVEELRESGVQVIPQGIGFPDAPVSNVPSDGLGEQLNPDTVALGLFMSWMGTWSAGKYYPKGSYVRAGDWTMVANKLTLENPEPFPTAAPTYVLPTPWVLGTTLSNVSVVECIQHYTMVEAGWVKEFRVWVPAATLNTAYEVIIINTTDPQNPTTQRIPVQNPTAGDWKVVGTLNNVVAAGSTFTAILASLNSSASTNISGGWAYLGPTQTGAPPAQNWTVDNQRTTFRIDKFDLDGTDRSTELEGVIADSTITVVQTDNTGLSIIMRVTGVLDNGTYMNYAVVLQNETGGGPKAGAVTTIDIDVPVPLATEYEAEAGFLPVGNPSWATIETALEFDGVDQGAPITTIYGIDFNFEPGSVSPDWDIVTTP